MGQPSSTFTDREIDKPIAATVNNLQVIPLHHLLLVRPEKDGGFSSGSKGNEKIIIPDAFAGRMSNYRKAEVLRTGPGFMRHGNAPGKDGEWCQMICKPGDVVLIKRDRGTEVEQQGERLLLINQDEVLCILVEEREEFF